MHSSKQITIRGDLDTIFDLAAKVEDWGHILPHYRYVKVLRVQGQRKWVRMSAWRDFVPVTWTAIETVLPGNGGAPGRICFRHIRGLVRGMDVEWWFKPSPDTNNILVGINHHLDNPPFPTRLLGPRLIESIVSRGFIEHIAGKTLLRVKELAESRIENRELGVENQESGSGEQKSNVGVTTPITDTRFPIPDSIQNI